MSVLSIRRQRELGYLLAAAELHFPPKSKGSEGVSHRPGALEMNYNLAGGL